MANYRLLTNGLIKQWGMTHSESVAYPLPFNRLDKLIVYAPYQENGIAYPNTSYVITMTRLDSYGLQGFVKTAQSYATLTFISWEATGI